MRSFLSLLSDQHDDNVFDIVARALFFVTVFLLPLFIFPSISAMPDFSKSVFVALAFVFILLFWLLARLKGGVLTFPKSLILLFWGVVTLSFVVSSLFSPAFAVSFEGLIYETGTAVSILMLFLVMSLAALLFQSAKNIFELYIVAFSSFLFVFLFQAGRFVFGNQFLSFGIFADKAGNVIGKWNDLGVFAGLFIILSLITLTTLPVKQWQRNLLYGTLAAGLFLLFVVNFYPAWVLVGFLALGIFVYQFSFARTKTQKTSVAMSHKTFPATSFVVLLLALAFLVSGNIISGFLNDRLNISQVEVRPSWDSTLLVLKETIKEQPFFGSGPNRFVPQWLRFKPDAVNASPFWNTDFRSGIGLLPTFAVTTGVVGTVALLLFFTAFLYKGFRFLFSSADRDVNYILFSSFTGALYIWIISLLYVPSTVLLFFAALFSGVFVGALTRTKKVEQYTLQYFKNPRLGFVVVLVLILVVITTVVGGYAISKKWLAFSTFQRGRALVNAGGDLALAEQHMIKALTYSASDAYYRALSEVKTRQLSALLTRQDLTPEMTQAAFRTMLGDSIRIGQQAVAYDETNYQNWLALFRVYRAVVPAVTGAYENALLTITKARELNPKSPALLAEQARLEVLNNNTSGARALLRDALTLKRDYVEAIFMLSQIDIREGNNEQAIAALEDAAFLAPGDEGLFFQLGLLRYNSREYEKATAAFEYALSLNSEFANARYFLGLAYYYVDRRAEAIAQFEQLEKSNPDNEDVKNILRNLKNGKAPFVDSLPPVFDEGALPPLAE